MLRAGDIIQFGWYALKGYHTRTKLMLIAMSIGVGSVVILTALGEGARNYVTNEFSALGTNLVIVIPGKNETRGDNPTGLIGITERDLTIDDALALTRHPKVRRIAPLNIGAAEVAWQGRKREVSVMGTRYKNKKIWSSQML